MIADTGHVLAVLDGFDAGYISRMKNERLPPNALTRALNLTVENSDAVKRYGSSKHNAIALSTALPVVSAYYTNGMIADKLIVTSGVKIINLSSGVEAVLETGLTSGQRYGFAEAIKGGVNYVYIAATGQAPRRWDGAAAATTVVAGPTENPRYLCWHKRRMWACSPLTINLWLSKRDDPETWDGTNYIPVLAPSDGIWTGLIDKEDYLIAFAEGAIFFVYGNDPEPPGTNIVTRKIGQRFHGCVAPYSIVEDEKTGAVYYVAKDGVYALEGQTPKYLSRMIEPDWKLVTAGSMGLCASVIDDDRLWVAVPHNGATANNRVYCFHLRKPGIPVTIFSGWAPAVFTKNFLTRQIYWGDDARAYVLKYDTTLFSDEGAAVDFDLISAGLTFGDPFGNYTAMRGRLQADVVTSGTCVISTGPDESNPDAVPSEFMEAPSATTAVPLALGATGPVYGDAGGDDTTPRFGIVDYPINLVADGGVARGSVARVRVRANNTLAMTLRRISVYAQDDDLGISEGA